MPLKFVPVTLLGEMKSTFRIQGAGDGEHTVPIGWLSTKDSEVPLRSARSPRGNGHCLTSSDACRAGGTSGTMLSLQS